MERIRNALRWRPGASAAYEPLNEDADAESSDTESTVKPHGTSFSWLDYATFIVVGVSMLWAWYATPPLIPFPVLLAHLCK